ncbi:ABC transporter permease [Clostridium sp. JN-1]|uniref:ABC transporter permease n=1 Tax=Clostridium sp. JN-1 TaxID=2483110 RepID=UPI000F0BBA04|nr:ABC transporter permease [Clostridium sp. JN-1]
MSLALILKSEFMKYKRSALYKIAFGIPILSLVLLFIDLHLRFDWLTSGKRLKQAMEMGINDKLGILIYTNHLEALWFFFLLTLIVLLSVIVNYAEYSENTWKQVLSRPVDRWKIYFSKWVVIFIFTIIAIIINTLGVIAMKNLFKADGSYILILKYFIFQVVTALGVISIQQFISCYIKNSLLAAGIGFAGVMSAYMMAQSKILGNIFPYSCFLRAMPFNDGSDSQTAAIFGIISCVIWLAVGILEFKNRDI